MVKVLEMKNITKDFSGVVVLNNVNFDLNQGEVHALVGANGAGKSTLMKVMNGILVNYSGEIVLDGNPVRFKDPADAFKKGIGMIHQELDLAANLSVYENIYLGYELCKGISLNKTEMRVRAQKLLDDLQFDIDAAKPVEQLPPAKQQLVLIARTIAMDSKIIVMDEPTSSLSIKEIENLFSIIKDLCARGISIVYISHFLGEIFRTANRVTILRDGELIDTCDIGDITHKGIIEKMVGHKVDNDKKHHYDTHTDEVLLEVKNLTQKNGIVKNINFRLHKGEVLGIAGVVGSGRTEVAKMIFGALRKTSCSEIYIKGSKVNINSPKYAVSRHIGFVSENRKTEGLILGSSIFNNVVMLPIIKKKGVFVSFKQMKGKIFDVLHSMSVKYSDIHQEVRSLSGGNQQKCVLGKWLSVDTEILILDQPTRGVDIGAKDEIYQLVDKLAKEGAAILYISDELEELYNLCDRIIVMKRGEQIAELDNYDRTLTKVQLLSSMIADSDSDETIGIIVGG